MDNRRPGMARRVLLGTLADMAVTLVLWGIIVAAVQVNLLHWHIGTWTALLLAAAGAAGSRALTAAANAYTDTRHPPTAPPPVHGSQERRRPPER